MQVLRALIGSLYCLCPCYWLVRLLRALIGSLYFLCPLLLASVTTLALVLRHSNENRSKRPRLPHGSPEEGFLLSLQPTKI